MNYARELQQLRARRDLEIKRLRELGKSKREIAREVGCAESAVGEALGTREANNERRRRHWQRQSYEHLRAVA